MITDRTVRTCLSHPICLPMALLPYEAILSVTITTYHKLSILGVQAVFHTSKLANKHSGRGAIALTGLCYVRLCYGMVTTINRYEFPLLPAFTNTGISLHFTNHNTGTHVVHHVVVTKFVLDYSCMVNFSISTLEGD